MENRVCKVCGKEFVPRHFNQRICDRDHYHACPNCGKRVKTTNLYHLQCCSRKCTSEHRRKTNLEKYGCAGPAGSQEVQSKMRATNRARFGVDWAGQNSDIRKKQTDTYLRNYGKEENPEGYLDKQKRTINTCNQRYGVPYVFQDKGFVEKSKQSSLDKYGTEYPMQSKEVQEIYKKSMVDKYGYDSIFKVPEYREKIAKTNIAKYGSPNVLQSDIVRNHISQTMLERYGVPWYCMTDECKQASGKIVSKINQSFAQLLDDHGINYGMEFRIGTLAYDFKIGNILVEIDPTFTHTCDVNMFDYKSDGLPIMYHVNKSKVAQEAGYHCIHVWDWDDWNKIVDLVSPHDSVYARNCYTKQIDPEEVDKFLNEFHLQGTCKGQIVSYGLYLGDTLMQIMTFGKPRYNRNYEWELLRLCTRHKVSVIGGPSKLFKNFIATIDPDSIISYCDKSKFEGKVYDVLGFTTKGSSSPSRHWYKEGKHITDNLLRQRGYDQLFGTSFGKGTSNQQLMLSNKWLSVYDCGQETYIWNRR